MHTINDSMTIHVTPCAGGLSIVAIDHDTKKTIQFTDFVMVGFSEEGEYVANHCTIPQVAESLFRLRNLYDELVEEAKIREKPKLSVLSSLETK